MNSRYMRAFTVLTFVLLCFYFGNAESQEFVTNGLIGFWTLDKGTVNGDILKDAWGKNDGTIKGSPKVVNGKIKDGLDFDGKDQYVLLPDMGHEPAVTVEAWTLAHSLPPVAHSCCIGIVSSAPEDQWVAGTVHFKFEAGAITADKNGSGKIRFDSAAAEEWYHAVYTVDTAANEFKLYINGKLAAEMGSGAEPNNLTHVRIASEHEGRYLPGIVDEVRIYKRALSADEVGRNFAVKTNTIAVVSANKLSIEWGMVKSQ